MQIQPKVNTISEYPYGRIECEVTNSEGKPIRFETGLHFTTKVVGAIGKFTVFVPEEKLVFSYQLARSPAAPFHVHIYHGGIELQGSPFTLQIPETFKSSDAYPEWKSANRIQLKERFGMNFNNSTKEYLKN
jgi:hypothetical protein